MTPSYPAPSRALSRSSAHAPPSTPHRLVGWLKELFQGPNDSHLYRKEHSLEQALASAKRAELKLRQRVSSELAGDYASAFLGSGLTFSELRDYQVGDDPRTIQWNVSARFGRPFVKLFREERQLKVFVALDVSASMSLTSRYAPALELTTLLVALGQRNRDAVGIATFAKNLLRCIRPNSKRSHYRKILYTLHQQPALERQTDLKAVLAALHREVPSGSILFILSDFEEGLPRDEIKQIAQKCSVQLISFADIPETRDQIKMHGFLSASHPEYEGRRDFLSLSEGPLPATFLNSMEEKWQNFRISALALGATPIRATKDSYQTLSLILRTERRKRR